ncbi:MAG: GNAT family N-acetyltransferase [Acidimicrobiia bacterium]|nr:GNAT family N-acetyltransferase [Acidimicrobiia bacterium]
MTIDDATATNPSLRTGPPTGPRPAAIHERDEPTLFHSEPWRRAVEATFGVRIDEFVPTSEPAGIAYYSLLSDVRGERIVCTPFSDVCDPLLGPVGWREFADHLQSMELPITIRPFRCQPAITDHSFERRHELLWHGIDLREGHEPVWDGLRSKVRTAIRRAPKQGITLRASSRLDDLKTFHAMHVELRKSKYRLLAQPFEFFAALHDGFGHDLLVITAEDHSGPVASMVYLAWNGVWYYKFSASLPRGYRPNAAMIIEACRHGAERGLQLLDLGRSDRDQPGLVSFKQQFASEELPLTTLHWQPDGPADPAGNAAGELLGAVTELLTAPDVPNEVTAAGGDLLYRYFA